MTQVPAFADSRITRRQWTVLLVAYLGWVFDLMDVFLMVLVRDSAMTELLGPGASAQEIERWKDHLAANGVVIESDFEWPQGGRSIYFRDPAGNSIEFAEPRIWGL